MSNDEDPILSRVKRDLETLKKLQKLENTERDDAAQALIQRTISELLQRGGGTESDNDEGDD
jgi:hypothetical protein